MAEEKPETVKVQALEAHTYNGDAYEIGDTYDAPVHLIDTLRVQGKAAPVDAASLAKRAAKPAKPAKATTKTRRGKK